MPTWQLWSHIGTVRLNQTIKGIFFGEAALKKKNPFQQNVTTNNDICENRKLEAFSSTQEERSEWSLFGAIYNVATNEGEISVSISSVQYVTDNTNCFTSHRLQSA